MAIFHVCDDCNTEINGDCCEQHPDSSVSSIATADILERLDTQIDRELDRLGWSSTTAPEGHSTLDCWNTPTTEQDGIVTLHDTQEVTQFHGQPLLETLRALPDDSTWDDLWHAILPHIAE